MRVQSLQTINTNHIWKDAITQYLHKYFTGDNYHRTTPLFESKSLIALNSSSASNKYITYDISMISEAIVQSFKKLI